MPAPEADHLAADSMIPVRSCCQVDDPHVHAQPTGWVHVQGRFRDFQRCDQKRFTVSDYKVGFTLPVRLKQFQVILVTDERNAFQPPRDGPDRNRSAGFAILPGEAAVIKGLCRF
jgi:hypothetical protein